MTERLEHWNNVYASNSLDKLGWFEQTPEKSIKLIESLNLEKDKRIIDVGCGTSLLTDYLLNNGYTDIICTDISDVALNFLMKRVQALNKGSFVEFIHESIVEPERLATLSDISLWHDRAVLHFLTSEAEKQKYFNLLRTVLAGHGYVILAEFAPDGAKKCSGLDVNRYSDKMLQKYLGGEFSLVKSFNYTYINPSGGERPYIYTLWHRHINNE